jgi:hypothetical protein
MLRTGSVTVKDEDRAEICMVSPESNNKESARNCGTRVTLLLYLLHCSQD